MSNQLNLKNVLSWKLVNENININIFNNEDLTKQAVSKSLDLDVFNNTKVEVEFEGKPAVFENRLYKKEIYFLESRLFDEDDQLIRSYLQTFEEDGNIVDFDEDVWGSTDWKLVNDEE